VGVRQDYGAMATDESRQPRPGAVLRQTEQVTPLELFFDLVFVLAITQCTALMSAEPTWAGLGKAMLVFGMLWWSWTGYAWLTSVVDPEEDSVRLVIFVAMAGLLVCSLCVPHAFDQLALTFAVAYGIVRAAHIALFTIASRDDPNLRRSVTSLAVSTTIAVVLLVAASALDGLAQGAVWALALLLDAGGPFLFGAEGWKLVPGHFSERHGLIVIIALGESIVAIGVGANANLTAGIAAAAVLGVALAAAMWWAYFDVVALVSARRLADAAPGRERNEMARDSFSYLHVLLVAGVLLVALGLKKTIQHVGDPLADVPAFALTGGLAIYLLGHVAIRLRNVHTLSRRRLGLAIFLFALFPVATALPALASVALVTVLIWGLIAYETRIYGEARGQVRHAPG
jgi:low temperature requirement protein LtrA